MTTQKYTIVTGNQAAAHIAYKVNEVCAIYPITPASGMSELVEAWSANQKENIFGSVPTTFEMQSEAGVAGALHGVLQAGSLATTFTASQGLLLMLPNMYKIAGELTPNVIHVATRSLATHALSVFGDHSDIMAARNTGYAFLGAASVQEATDFALIAQASTLQSRIPFVQFFDGFRTSHETAKIEMIADKVIRAMIDNDLVQAHRDRAMNPERPFIRGTSQTADVFFQSREAVNSWYNACPDIVQNQMNTFSKLTGRQYNLFDYVGHADAEQVIVAMASATETIEDTIKYLNRQGEKVGLIKVRLFRPFSKKHLVHALPATCKSIAVLDRTKEPGASGEPLYLDVMQSLMEVMNDHKFMLFPKIVGGRFGLSSKEFTPNMVTAIVENLKQEQPKNNFTIGINDDVTYLSLACPDHIQIQNHNYQAVFYETKSDKSTTNFDNFLQLIGNQTNSYIQGYTECNYKKSSAESISHLRIGSQQIKAPYLITNADFVACDILSFRNNDRALLNLKPNGILLVNTALNAADFWKELSEMKKQLIRTKNILLYVINICDLAENYLIEEYNISGLQACFPALKNDLFHTGNLLEVKQHLIKVDTSKQYKLAALALDHHKDGNEGHNEEVADSLLGKLLAGKGEELPVSVMPSDGTFQSDTSKFNTTLIGIELPAWNTDLCTQCGACSMACPQGAIRIKVYDDTYLAEAPSGFKSTKSIEEDWETDLLNYTVQVHPEQCTACNHCMDACPAEAFEMVNKSSVLQTEKDSWNYFETIPEFERSKINVTKVSQQQLQEPLFKYPLGTDGCGEAAYLKLLSQLFGDNLLIANATGTSSIFGGSLPATPWSKNKAGRGPAWSNSLFEDNAEFGLGFRLSIDQQEQHAKTLLRKLMHHLDFDLIHDIMGAKQLTETDINEQRDRVRQLKAQLNVIPLAEAKQLLSVADSLVKKSVWMVGGDGWAYDIGYGGLDHVISTGKNVNILVLDNEVYANTGGQMSKATPFGASAQMAINGKQRQKKDLGLIAMSYDDVYVASVAIGADQEHTLKTFVEAESHQGPSIIIAYCHNPSHGIDMKNPSQYHQAAVKSGQWLLYRNDPRRAEKGLIPLQLDSDPISIKIEDYLRMEQRFAKLFEHDKTTFKALIQHLQKQVDKRFYRYKLLAAPKPEQLE